MFSFKIYSNERRGGVVSLRILSNRRKAEMSLGLVMPQEELDDAMSPKPRLRNVNAQRILRNYMTKLEQVRADLLTSGRRNEDVSKIHKMVEKALFGADDLEEEEDRKDLFCRFYERCVEKCANAGYKASRTYTLAKIRKLMDHADELTFGDITLKWLNDFDEKLMEAGASKNTRNIHFKNIRTVMNRAIDEELTQNYPFRRFKIKAEETRKRSLPIEELRRVFKCAVEPHQEFYRDMFKLIFMLIGINTVDLYNLKEVTEEGRVEYKRAKTKRLYSVKVEPEAMEIIKKWKGRDGLTMASDRWISHKDFMNATNKALQKIGNVERRGLGGKKTVAPYWPKLTTYWARHTWATIAYNHCGVPKDIISQALGHKSGVGVTEIYLDKDRALVDEANRRVIDFVLYGKKHEKPLGWDDDH